MRQFREAVRQDFLRDTNRAIVPLSAGERSRPMAY